MTHLVLGSTGLVGPHVVSALLARGQQVRALVRNAERAAATLPAEVELFEGSFEDVTRLEHALDGVDSMLLLTPHGQQMFEQQQRVIGVASDAGVRVVKISGTSVVVTPDGPDAGVQHWKAEQALMRSGTPFVVLRPNAFMQGLLMGLAKTAAQTGRISNPLAASGLSLIDCADIGRAAAACLVDAAHDGRTYVLTGPSAPTYAQLGQELEPVLNRPVAVDDVTPAEVAAAMRANGADGWSAAHLEEMLNVFRAGRSEYVSDDVEVLTGEAPTSVAEFLLGHRYEFVPVSA
jgi:uncharacterized protein YbjT (DUF2867 family)